MYENVTNLVSVTLRNGIEEGRRFSNKENDLMTLKDLNQDPFDVKISLLSDCKGDLFVKFSTITPQKTRTLSYVKFPEYT